MVEADDVQLGGLRDVHGHGTAALLELRRPGHPFEEAIPRAHIVLEDLLNGLGG
jgi:hypothetical protein